MRKLLYTVLAVVLTFSMVLPIFAQGPQPPNLSPQNVYQWDYPPSFGNVTITVVGDAGHNLKPYEFWKDDFAKVGITINVIEVPFDGVYEKEKTEFVAGTGAFDVVTFYPAYIGDFAGNGYLEPLESTSRRSRPRSGTPTWTTFWRRSASCTASSAARSTPCPSTATCSCCSTGRI